MLKKIKKAVIPAGGLGINFLPATKSQPKEMLPIVDKPALQYIVEEAVASGIEEILIITGKDKGCIEDHFDRSVALELALKNKRATDRLEMIKNISDMATIYFVRQKEPKGLADAINCAKSFIAEGESFAILLGDNIVDSEVPGLKQLLDVYDRYNTPVIAVQDVGEKYISRYGAVEPLEVEDGVYKIKSLVEKPKEKAPSNKAIMGRYIVNSKIFDLIENQEKGVNGELQLTDTLNSLLTKTSVYAYQLDGKVYDLATTMDYLKATVDFGLKNDILKDEFLNFIKEKSKK